MAAVDAFKNILIGANVAQGGSDYGNNIVVGYEAMTLPTGGVYDNVFIGKYVANTATNVRNNTVIGTFAAGNLQAGQNNVCIGIGAGYDLKNSNYNVFAGFESGFTSTGSQNLFMGVRSGYESRDSNNNVFMGSHSGANNLSASDNVFVGNGAGMFNRYGNLNVFLGGQAGHESNAGSRGVFVGYDSGRANEGSDNVFLGTDSGRAAHVDHATLVGSLAGSNASGTHNVLVGYRAAGNLAGSNNVVVGSMANVLTSNGSVVLGSNVRVQNATNVVAIGTNDRDLHDVQNAIVLGKVPESMALQNDTVYFGTSGNLVLEANTAVVSFPGNVDVAGRITFSGLTVDYEELLNKPTRLSYFPDNDIFIPWANVTSVPQRIVSVNALTNDNRILFYASSAVQTAGTLSWIPQSQRLGVGISNPAYSVDVSGYVRSTQGYLLESDARKKTNLQTIGNALERIRQIRGYTYEYNDHPGTREAGIVAQEVRQVLPEAVATDPASDILSVKYDALVALLIEAVKELDDRTRSRCRDCARECRSP